MKKIFYLMSCLMLFVTACKKDKQEPAPEKKIIGVFTITGLQVKSGNHPKIDVYDQLTECQQKDTWDFEEGGSFLFGGAATTECQDGDYSGTWTLNGKTFTIATQQNTTAYQLESNNGNSFVLSTSGTLNSEPATYYLTFTKK